METLVRQALLSAFLIGGPAAQVALYGQATQMRAKVSSAIPNYVPAGQVRAELEIPGTDSLADLGDEWNRGFKGFHPGARITYVAKPSSEAINELVAGKKVLIISGREMTAEESTRFKAAHGYQPMRIPVCMDANIVFVNKGNPITSITMEQLDAIYSKSRLGGAKEPVLTWGDLKVRRDLGKHPINAYARKAGSATRASFQTLALKGGEFRAGIIDKEDYPSLAEAILTDEAGIAFGPLSTWYAANKVLPVVPHQGSEARFPTQENITSSKYPMPRLYFVYVNRAPGKPLDPGINEFLHYALTQEGQNAIADIGLIPGPPEFLTIALKRLDR